MIQTALELADFHPPQRRTLPQACFIRSSSQVVAKPAFHHDPLPPDYTWLIFLVP